MSSPLTLTGGNFSDAEGNPLDLGYLIFQLSQDSSVNGINVCAGVEIKVPLDSGGSADGTVAIWGNDVLTPVNSYYRVTGYTAQGQPAWGPNNQQVIGSGSFDLSVWVPNQIFSWTPSLAASVLLETDGTPNEVQSILDLKSGNDITLTDNGDGSVTIDTAQGGWILQINGSNEAPTPHSTVNFQQGNGITFSDNGSGQVTWDLKGFQTSGQGFFLGGQDFMPIGDDTGGFWDNTGDAVYAVQVSLKVPFKISRMSAFVVTGSAGAFTAALFDAAGTTKLLDAGANAFSLAGSQRFVTVTTSAQLFPAGTYWFAFGAPASANGSIVAHELGTWVTQLLNGIDLINPQTSPTRIGKSSNSLSGGAMPSSLGTITPLDHTNPVRIPAVIFAV